MLKDNITYEEVVDDQGLTCVRATYVKTVDIHYDDEYVKNQADALGIAYQAMKSYISSDLFGAINDEYEHLIGEDFEDPKGFGIYKYDGYYHIPRVEINDDFIICSFNTLSKIGMDKHRCYYTGGCIPKLPFFVNESNK